MILVVAVIVPDLTVWNIAEQLFLIDQISSPGLDCEQISWKHNQPLLFALPIYNLPSLADILAPAFILPPAVGKYTLLISGVKSDNLVGIEIVEDDTIWPNLSMLKVDIALLAIPTVLEEDVGI